MSHLFLHQTCPRQGRAVRPPRLFSIGDPFHSFQHENPRNKNAFLARPKGAPKDKLSYYRVAPYYYFQVWYGMVWYCAVTADDLLNW